MQIKTEISIYVTFYKWMTAYRLPKLFLMSLIRQQESHSSLFWQNVRILIVCDCDCVFMCGQSLSSWVVAPYMGRASVWMWGFPCRRGLCMWDESSCVGGAFLIGNSVQFLINQQRFCFKITFLGLSYRQKWLRLYLFCTE